jgi:tetratricopeptide (TPR) repeat protein
MAKKSTQRFRCAADAAAALHALDGEQVVFVDPEDSSRVIAHDADTLIAETVRLDTLALRTPLPSVQTPASTAPSTVEQAFQKRADADSTEGVSPLVRRPQPPGPREWKRAAGRGVGEAKVRAVGLSLFSLRETPLVGRDQACESIWDALCRVHEAQRLHGVIVRGDAGTGKTRLILEMARRAEELGVAHVFRATHSRLGGPTDGLGRVLERHFVAWGLDDDGALERVRSVLGQWDSDADASFLDEEAERIVGLMRGRGVGDHDDTVGDHARLASLSRLVARASRERPVIVWLDDLQWAHDSLEWVELLGRDHPDIPVLILATVLEDFSDSLSGTRERIDALTTLDVWRELNLERLDEDAHALLIRSMLDFAPAEVERLSACTKGEPLFAFQLVSDLVDGERLEPSPAGYRLDDQYSLPKNMDELWLDRLEHVLGPSPLEEDADTDSQVAWKVLEVASVLGTRIVDSEWRAVCARAGWGPPSGLLERLGRAGLVELSEDGWAFVHQTLTLTLESTAERAGRLEQHHNLCADVLETLYPNSDRWGLARLAEHVLEGGEPDRAAQISRSAARAMIQAQDLREAERLLAMRQRALEQSGANTDARPSVVNEILMAQVDRGVGRKTDARERLERALSLAREHDWRSELVEILREVGELEANSGRVENALKFYRRALQHLEPFEDTGIAARVYMSQGWAVKTLGRFDEAHPVLERARRLYAESGDELGEVGVLNPIGFTYLAQGDLESTREVCRDGIRLASAIGHRNAEAGFWTTLGEVERFDGDWDEARRCYAEAERLDTICGSKHAYLVRFNRLLAELGAENYSVAEARMSDLEPALERIGMVGWLSTSIELIKAACAAGREDWTRARSHIDAAVAALDERPMIERDIAWTAEHVARLALGADRESLARPVLDMARQQWEQLEDSEALERLDAMAQIQ